MSRAKRLMVAVDTWQPSAISSIFSAVTRIGLRRTKSAMLRFDADPSARTPDSTWPNGDCANATSADDDLALLPDLLLDIQLSHIRKTVSILTFAAIMESYFHSTGSYKEIRLT